MEKKELRKKMQNKLSELTEGSKMLKTEAIYTQLLKTDAWKVAEVIGITISMGNEINTYNIIEEAWKQEKKVVIPKCIPREKKLVFYYINSYQDLEDSFYGLKEPKIDKCIPIHSDEISFLVVPGMIYDENGYRIGYGGGYYDRFLQAHGDNIMTCSICYDFQVLQEIAMESHDIPVKMIITDSRVITPLE